MLLTSFLTLGIASGCGELVIESSPRRKTSMAQSDHVLEQFDNLWDADLLRSYLQGDDHEASHQERHQYGTGPSMQITVHLMIPRPV